MRNSIIQHTRKAVTQLFLFFYFGIGLFGNLDGSQAKSTAAVIFTLVQLARE